jgi:hypothetical protein
MRGNGALACSTLLAQHHNGLHLTAPIPSCRHEGTDSHSEVNRLLPFLDSCPHIGMGAWLGFLPPAGRRGDCIKRYEQQSVYGVMLVLL